MCTLENCPVYDFWYNLKSIWRRRERREGWGQRQRDKESWGDRQSDEAGSGGFKLKFQITVRER
jgi:hypothetical protein